MSFKASPSNSHSVQAPVGNTNSKVSKDNKQASYYCKICNISVSCDKNLAVHNGGRKHQNKLKRQKPNENSKTNFTQSFKSPENPSTKLTEKSQPLEQSIRSGSKFKTFEKPPTESDKSIQYLESSAKSNRSEYLESTPAVLESRKQSPVTIQVNLEMSNQSNRNTHQSRHYKDGYPDPKSRPPENYQYAQKYSDQHNNFRRPPRGNSRHFDNRNFGWQSWPPNHPNNTFWNNGNRWFPPPNNRDFRNFSRPFSDINQYGVNPHYFDKDWNETFNSNENFSPYENVQLPVDNNADCSTKRLDNVTTEDVKHEQAGESSANLDDTCNESKVPIQPVRKRVRDRIRVIPNASVNRVPTRNSLDSDDAQKEGNNDKLQGKKNVLTENVTGKRIAHWINPSNQKDEAEVRRLVTELSKSKKKENLLRLKQQSENRGDRRDSSSDEVNSTLESICSATEANENVLLMQSSRNEKLSQVPSSVNTETTSAAKRRKRSEAVSVLKLPASSCSLTTSVDSSSMLANSLQEEHIISSAFSERKRKSSSKQSSTNSKKKTTTSEDVQACIDAVIKGDNDQIPVSKISEKSSHSCTYSEESVPQNKVPYVKKEPVDAIDDSQIQSFTESLNLHELVQIQQKNLENNFSDYATMTPVESLINLFASGNVKVKKEFDDPLIDAIRTVDPAVLNRVCDGQSTTSSTKAATPPQEPPPLPIENPSNNATSVTGSLKTILRQLQKISNKEEKVKTNLQEADQKIQEYQLLLDQWKTKKIKFQSEEEILRNQRNSLVKSMNDLVMDPSTVSNSLSTSDLVDSSSSHSQSSIASDHSTSSNSLLNAKGLADKSSCISQEKSRLCAPESAASSKKINTESIIQQGEEEVAILPLPLKSHQKEIPVIDLDEVDPVEKIINTVAETCNEALLNEGVLYDNLSKWKKFAAHKVVVNSLQVFENFLYTCSNDSTAKRFNLKDLSQVVTYKHDKKNVIQLCVEKVRGVTLVFTICTASNIISSFKAEDGSLLKNFNFDCNVASICKGRGKIYAGLRNGSIFTCSRSEQKEIVNIGEPIRNIALTYQGSLSVLVTLATNGCVSVRDANRNGLLIRNLKSIRNVPLFMTVHSDCIYLSGSGMLVVIEIGTGKCIQKYELSAPYTSLAVYQDHILTTSYSGLVRCHSREREKEVKLYYGAGHSSLTCINVYHGWVFTGNRFGDVDVFKFDPHASFPCQFGKCDMIFSRQEDLELHALSGKDHDFPVAGSKCSWRSCLTKIPRNSSIEVIKSHLGKHIQEIHSPEHQTLYNLSS